MLGDEQPNHPRRRTVRPDGVCRRHYFRSPSSGRGELAFGRLVSPPRVAGQHPADRGSVGHRPTDGPGLWWWILPSTIFYLVARVSRAASALRLATPLTFPFVRTLLLQSAPSAWIPSSFRSRSSIWMGGRVRRPRMRSMPAGTGMRVSVPYPLLIPAGPYPRTNIGSWRGTICGRSLTGSSLSSCHIPPPTSR